MHKAYVDGACRPNPGRGAYGYVFYDDKNRIIKRGSGTAGEYTTNNAAEYTAVIKGLQAAQQLGIKRLTVCSDSQVVVLQLEGIYQVHNPTLQALKKEAADLVRGFASVRFVHVPRKNNYAANHMAQRQLL